MWTAQLGGMLGRGHFPKCLGVAYRAGKSDTPVPFFLGGSAALSSRPYSICKPRANASLIFLRNYLRVTLAGPSEPRFRGVTCAKPPDQSLRSQPGWQGSIATSIQSSASMYTTGQTRIFAAPSILLRSSLCNLNRKKKLPEDTESRGL